MTKLLGDRKVSLVNQIHYWAELISGNLSDCTPAGTNKASY
ncbi:hypothetical protein [Vibrio parahaemolyticus]|nr:hypothetical protein [Vibrio parahaemolyticus]